MNLPNEKSSLPSEFEAEFQLTSPRLFLIVATASLSVTLSYPPILAPEPSPSLRTNIFSSRGPCVRLPNQTYNIVRIGATA